MRWVAAFLFAFAAHPVLACDPAMSFGTDNASDVADWHAQSPSLPPPQPVLREVSFWWQKGGYDEACGTGEFIFFEFTLPNGHPIPIGAYKVLLRNVGGPSRHVVFPDQPLELSVYEDVGGVQIWWDMGDLRRQEDIAFTVEASLVDPQGTVGPPIRTDVFSETPFTKPVKAPDR